MANLRKYTVTLSADTRDALRGLDAVTDAMGALNRVTMRVGRMFANMVQETADYGDAAAVAADRTGLSSVAWQEYSHAAEIAGISSSNLITALRRMGDNAMDARKGAGMAKDELIALYGSLDNIPKGQDELFVSLLDHLAELQTAGPEAAQKAQQVLASIFGRSGALIAPLTRLGADAFAELRKEAEEFGLVLSPDITRATQKWNDEVIRVKRSWDGIRNTIGGRLLPQVTKIATMTQEWVREQRALIEAGLAPWLKMVEVGLVAVHHFMERFRRGFNQFLEPLKFVVKGISAFAAVVAVGGTLIGGLASLGTSLIALAGVLKALSLAWAAFASPLAPFVALALAIGAAIGLAYLVFEDFITLLRGGESAIGALLEHLGILDEFKSMLESWGDLFDALGKKTDGFWGGVKRFFSWIADSAVPILKTLLNLVMAFAGAPFELLFKASDAVADFMTKQIDPSEARMAEQQALALRHGRSGSLGQSGGLLLNDDVLHAKGVPRALLNPVSIGNPRPGQAAGGQLSNTTTVNFTNNAIPAEQLGPVIQSQVNALAANNMNREGG